MPLVKVSHLEGNFLLLLEGNFPLLWKRWSNCLDMFPGPTLFRPFWISKP